MLNDEQHASTAQAIPLERMWLNMLSVEAKFAALRLQQASKSTTCHRPSLHQDVPLWKPRYSLLVQRLTGFPMIDILAVLTYALLRVNR